MACRFRHRHQFVELDEVAAGVLALVPGTAMAILHGRTVAQMLTTEVCDLALQWSVPDSEMVAWRAPWENSPGR
ncbi:hypothetical protein CK224_03295 [Mesorhizobium sp. WSM3862]|nr:hypothetical protein CK224_03295 [Mesorhizobium sp. WSM3862]